MNGSLDPSANPRVVAPVFEGSRLLSLPLHNSAILQATRTQMILDLSILSTVGIVQYIYPSRTEYCRYSGTVHST